MIFNALIAGVIFGEILLAVLVSIVCEVPCALRRGSRSVANAASIGALDTADGPADAGIVAQLTTVGQTIARNASGGRGHRAARR